MAPHDAPDPLVPDSVHAFVRPAPERLFPPDQHFVQLQSSASTSAEANIAALELSDFIDFRTIQSLMDDFFEIVHMPMVIVDLNGKVLAGVGWQAICSDFHRVNRDSCRNCIESDTQLTVGIHPGEHRLYKCKNNLWDVATPLMVGEQHIGNIFSGQFFFDDETIDREYFVVQAKKYGFPEEEYIAALNSVPRLSRHTVEKAMSFMTKLAHILSDLGYSKLKMAQSISERRQAQEALLRSEKLALVGQLAGGVAHDFNNLLMVISSYSELIGQSCNDDRQRGYVQHLVNAARRGGELTAQLLAFSRKQVIAPCALNLNDVVKEAITMLPRLIGENIELDSRMGKNLACCQADPGQIQQVLMNLCVNARDAMPRGGRLTIETSNVRLDNSCNTGDVEVTPGDYVVLAVTDTGIGMDADTQSHIFEPFFTTKEHGKGTGLGLATVYGIVTQNGGYVSAHSQLGHGTTFKVYLPSIHASASEIKKQHSSATIRGKGKVLLVEDDRALRESTAEFLRSCGYTVVAAEHGRDALQKLNDVGGKVDVLLTDVIMPGMSGPELAKEVIARNPAICVVYMSGYSETTNMHEFATGREQYLQKPFPLKSLSQILANMQHRWAAGNA